MTKHLQEIEVVNDFTVDDLMMMALGDESLEPDPEKRQGYVLGFFISSKISI